MPFELWQGLLIPFAGTTLGAACVFFMRNNLIKIIMLKDKCDTCAILAKVINYIKAGEIWQKVKRQKHIKR